MKKPALTVIDGDFRPSLGWLSFPPTVAVRSPFDAGLPVMARIAKERAVKAARSNRRDAALDLWSAVLGQPPAVHGIEERYALNPIALTCLADAYACFRGIRRPFGDADDGANVVVYVTRPQWRYAYAPYMGCGVMPEKVPLTDVFVAYVKLDHPDPVDIGYVGILTHWHFVEAERTSNGEMLPDKYADRYDERLW